MLVLLSDNLSGYVEVIIDPQDIREGCKTEEGYDMVK